MPPRFHQIPLDLDQITDDFLLDEVPFIPVISFQWDFTDLQSTMENLVAVFYLNRIDGSQSAMIDAERCFQDQIYPMMIADRMATCHRIREISNDFEEVLDIAISRIERGLSVLISQGVEDSLLDTLTAILESLKRYRPACRYYCTLVNNYIVRHKELICSYERPLTCPLRERIEVLEERLNIREGERRNPMKNHFCDQKCVHEKGKCACALSELYDEERCAKKEQERLERESMNSFQRLTFAMLRAFMDLD
ncbi:hypothetical protein EG329_000854 [Mollisiaceae sp. DMI_Dod_QoI]|nr:hypothetical protein EG329_000854 [Helotiales sp. DMI_Dod_QoI]